MKFTDGYWMLREGHTLLTARDVDEIVATDDALTVYAATAPLTGRGATLNRPVITVRLDTPAPGVVGVLVEHHAGARPRGPEFPISRDPIRPQIVADAERASLTSGALTAHATTRGPLQLDFLVEGRVVTSSLPGAMGLVTDDHGDHYVREQLALGVNEHVYGLGERFGPLIKNGQSVEIWNADGGTSSEQAYKNVPFFLSDAGYGVFVAHPEQVDFEVASEAVSRTQFSVAGQRLRYYVIAGPEPKTILERYTALTGRPARVPHWSYGLWLSTSFTTDYDEQTVTGFLDGMAERDLPLSVFHFDCFWMRRFRWCDFRWDPDTFPEPEQMLQRLHERGLKVCVWINPYIAQRSELFAEAADQGFLLRTTNGDVWQWDLWQAGMGLVDFTNPDARAWFAAKLRGLLDQGVDAFKTDFGERIPTDGVVWHDGSDPQRMHNYYTQLYNQTVHDVLAETRGADDAVLFARSATAGGQQFPVHWGGDCASSFVSMAESLRGGLSLSLSGFGFWSHDIGGFEGTPDPAVFKRWVAFGLLSSHSRLHGSSSYRVPWAFDDEAVDVTRRFVKLKHRLMPYLAELGEQAHDHGWPVMRPLLLEFPADRTAALVETQYLVGDRLLVAPVLSADGDVEYYLPDGTWTHLLSGEQRTGGRWHRERYGFDSLPLFVRPGTVLPWGSRDDRPDYDHADGVTLRAFGLGDGQEQAVRVGAAHFQVRRDGTMITATSPDATAPWSLQVDDHVVAAAGNRAELASPSPS